MSKVLRRLWRWLTNASYREAEARWRGWAADLRWVAHTLAQRGAAQSVIDLCRECAQDMEAHADKLLHKRKDTPT